MTRDEAKAAAQVLLAYADGQEIECVSKGISRYGKWQGVTDPQFDFSSNEYRIKPKPREWWIVKTGETLAVFANPLAPIRGHEIIKVREVIE